MPSLKNRLTGETYGKYTLDNRCAIASRFGRNHIHNYGVDYA